MEKRSVLCLYFILLFHGSNLELPFSENAPGETTITNSQNVQRYAVLIDEIMANPSPPVGLPDLEWVELKNVSGFPVNLQGWHFAFPSGPSGNLPDFMLQPDSFLIVCSTGALVDMSAFGKALPVTNFSPLKDEGGLISLIAADGTTIHSVGYSDAWYSNDLKKNGGWSLEMIDTKNPCTGNSNWTASLDPKGGTPGKKNSVDAVNPDRTPPRLKFAYTADSITIVAVFDEPLDSLKGATKNNYSMSGGPSILSVSTMPPLFNTVGLTLQTPMQPNSVYTLMVQNVSDCNNNVIAGPNEARVGLPSEASALDLVINEILYNPKSNGYDYVEFYNRSDRVFDASKLFVANRNNSGTISSIKQISSTPFFIFPGDYFVITESAASLALNYLVKSPDAVIELASLPSYPDDAGDVILLNDQGSVVDEVKYEAGWQFKLIDNPAGVALERIDPDGPSQDASNWHSAASTAGYGTPGYKNSQYKQTQTIDATITVSPRIFSPDNDGYNDISTIQYKLGQPGYVANITIFDAKGNPVRYLVKNAILGLAGQWNWDGLDEKGNELATGAYIVYTEIFNLQGKEQHFKNVVVLARKLN